MAMRKKKETGLHAHSRSHTNRTRLRAYASLFLFGGFRSFVETPSWNASKAARREMCSVFFLWRLFLEHQQSTIRRDICSLGTLGVGGGGAATMGFTRRSLVWCRREGRSHPRRAYLVCSNNRHVCPHGPRLPNGTLLIFASY